MRARLFGLVLSGVWMVAGIHGAPPAWDDLFARGEQALVRGEYVSAATAFQAALEGLREAGEREAGENDPRLPSTLARLGAAKFLLGDLDAASSLMSQAVTLWQRRRGEDDLNVASARMDLGEIQMAQGRFAEAQATLRDSLSTTVRILGPTHARVAMAKKSLGALALRRGLHNQAEPLLIDALNIFRKSNPLVPRELANCLNAMAQLHIVRAEFERAERLLQEALSIHEKADGPDHPLTLAGAGDLASLLVHRRQFGRAEPLLRRTVQGGERRLGPNHPALIRPLADLGLLYSEERKFLLAESALRRARLIAGAASANEPLVLNRLAQVYIRQGKFQDAAPLLERVARSTGTTPLSGRERAIGSYYLAQVHAAQGRIAQAELSFLQAIELLEKYSTGKDPEWIVVLNDYAALIRRNRSAEVRAIENRIKTIRSLAVK